MTASELEMRYKPLVEFDKRRLAPDALAQLFECDNLASLLGQDAQDSQGLRLNFDGMAVAHKPSPVRIEFVLGEP